MGFVALLGTGRAGSPDESLVSFQVNILVQLTPHILSVQLHSNEAYLNNL